MRSCSEKPLKNIFYGLSTGRIAEINPEDFRNVPSVVPAWWTLATNREEETLVHVRCRPELQNTSMKSIQFFVLWGGNNDHQPSRLNMKTECHTPPPTSDHVFPGTVASEPPAERARPPVQADSGRMVTHGTLVLTLI